MSDRSKRGREPQAERPTRNTNLMMRRRNLRVTEQLLGELEAGRFDSALTRRILDAPSSTPRLLRACFLAQARSYASARADVEIALEHGANNPVVRLVAGVVLYTTRDYQRALDQFEAAAKLSNKAAHRAYQQIISCAGGLGWDHDVRQALERAIAAEPHDPSWRAQAVAFFARGRHHEAALEHALAGLELTPESARLWMEAAGLHGQLDQREPCRAALVRALELAPREASERLPYLREGRRVAIDAGDFELAAACSREALELDPKLAESHVELAELHAWRGEDEQARVALESALALDPDCPAALRMRGALELRAGRPDDAIASLTRAIEVDEREYQAHVWLSEAYLRSERFDEAHAQLHHGTMNAGGFLFVAWLLRFLIVAYQEQTAPDTLLTPARTEEFAEALGELCPELAARALSSRRQDDTLAAVEAALAELRGNRSVQATRVDDSGNEGGTLHRLHVRTGCRHESRWALQLLRVAPAELCLAKFDEILARYPGSSLPICHRGELHMWLGNTAQARADLERAIEIVRGTRWAWIGLSTLGLLEGDYQASLDINAEGVAVMHDTEGPAIYVYRGEAKRKLGRIDEAIEELERAVKWHPARASATINLALCFHVKGDEARFDPLWRRLRDEQACGLLSDAARELGVVLLGDEGEEPSFDDKARVLEHALAMMGGNRSSGLLSYWTREGKLRFVPLWPHRGQDPHERDAKHLEQGKRMLLRALAHYSGPRSPG